MAFEHALVARGDDDVRDLRREKALEPPHPLDLGDLIGHAPFERAIPGGEVRSLRLHLIVQRLRAQHGLHPRHQRDLVHRLGEIFVGPRFQSDDDVLRIALGGDQDDRGERQGGILLEPAADLDTVEPRHHHVEQDQVRKMLSRRSQRRFAVGGLHDLVTIRLEPRVEDVAVRLVVVNDKDKRGIVHGKSPQHYCRYSLTFARTWRGL